LFTSVDESIVIFAHVRAASGRDLRHGLLSGIYFGVGSRECVAQLRVVLFVGDHRRVGVEFPGLSGQSFPVAVGREDADLEAAGVFAGDVERLHAD